MQQRQTVFNEVEKLYAEAPTSMGAWMWRNHTQWVANRADKLARKYGADTEIAYCAALLHDLGDARYERGHPDFDAWSAATSKTILAQAGFDDTTADAILEAVRTHACRPGKMPTTPEGNVLATADALWHLQTSFFPVICYMNRPDNTHSYPEWQEWFRQKIDRDFNTKIRFDDEKAEAADDYAALLNVFGKKSLD